jgi:LPPG:FO 2-phospho-L-lactate transferase
MPDLDQNANIVCLAGGVGGAKLAEGLAQILPGGALTVIVNTGDDFQHLGLTICPDLDTVTYTLGGVANPETGWGRAGESWRTIAEVARLGGPDWFRLGDLDLAAHLVRTEMLAAGKGLTAVTRHLCQSLEIDAEILPMSDRPAPTQIDTGDAVLPFQTWFVREQWRPPVQQVVLPQDVRATPAVMKRLEKADYVIIAPSNPFVSVDPILNVYPIRAMIMDLPRAVVAVSPIIGGEAVKGPAAKMMAEMGMPVTATAVAEYYGALIDGFVHEETDEAAVSGLAALATQTMMRTAADRRRLAQETLDFAQRVGSGR